MDIIKTIRQTTRPGLSYIFGIAFCVAFFKNLIPTEAFCTVVGMIIIWWFKSRDEEKNIERIVNGIKENQNVAPEKL